MRFDHISIVAPDCAGLRSFFVEIAGLQEGARPPFGVAGYWLYLDQVPVVHLIERAPSRVGSMPGPGPGPGPAAAPARIDHMALRIDSAVEWQQLLRRLRQHQLPYQLSGMGVQAQQQLFVTPVPAVTVEFVIAARHLV